MPGAGGKRGKARQQAQPKRTKRGSGNPAKRAAAERAAAVKQPAPSSAGASAFGFGAEGDGAAETRLPADYELPKDLRDLL